MLIEIIIDSDVAFAVKRVDVYPIRQVFIVANVFKLAEKQNVAGNFGSGVFEGIIGQTNSPNEVCATS